MSQAQVIADELRRIDLEEVAKQLETLQAQNRKLRRLLSYAVYQKSSSDFSVASIAKYHAWKEESEELLGKEAP